MSAVTKPSSAFDWKSIDKRHFVMANALELLTDVGYQGLTMRGLAERCEMSLSNVQYYFRTKDELIGDIADRYFGDCNAVLLAHFDESGSIEDRAGLESLLTIILEHGQQMTDMCRVFRELWAIASRHEPLAVLLNEHYQRLGETIDQHLAMPTLDSDRRAKVVTLLLTMSEGYSIVGPARLSDHDDTISLFASILMDVATGEATLQNLET